MSYLARHVENNIYEIQFEEAEASDVISLDDLKAHLNITFTDDDTYLTDLITACRQAVEKYCNISLVEKSITVIGDLYCELELPYGPVIEFTSAYLKNNSEYILQVENSDYELGGIENGFQRFRPFIGGRWKLNYNAEFTRKGTITDLILDIKRICGYCYEHKGDEALMSLQGGQGRPKGLDEAIELFASRHRRLQWV